MQYAGFSTGYRSCKMETHSPKMAARLGEPPRLTAREGFLK